MSLSKCLEKLKFDTRMTDWNLTQKKVNQQDIQKHLKSLDDVSHLSEPLQIEEEQQEPPSSEEG